MPVPERREDHAESCPPCPFLRNSPRPPYRVPACGPFAIDTYLPAFPQIARGLNTPIGNVQLTLAVFLLGLASGQVLWGTLSDHVGRRWPLLAGAVLYAGGAAACAAAGSIEMPIGARFLMGLGGSAGVVLSRAIVRDLFTEDHTGNALPMAGLIAACSVGACVLLVAADADESRARAIAGADVEPG